MKRFILFLVLWVNLADSSKLTQKKREGKVEEIREILSISEINKGHDDVHKTVKPQDSPQDSSIVNKNYLWKSPVEYIFDENIGLETKAVVLRALDRFRLKSCIDFKPWGKKEEYFLRVVDKDGCWSYIGRYEKNGQDLSLSYGCEYIAIVEHELLHALGFQHEHQRFDRDDYVTINFTNVEDGLQYNFDKGLEELFSPQGSPYDYWSVMHYGQFAFSNGNGFTIIPKIPKFRSIIGQMLGMSGRDVQELNMLYECESSLVFMLHCDFSHDMACPMTHCSKGLMRWEKVLQALGGPTSDHSSLPSGSMQEPVGKTHHNGTSYFMHVSTANGTEGDSAWLETKRMAPKRACITKCLQFYYYHKDSESDDLNVWIREFENEQDHQGRRHLVEKISGPLTKHWQIKYVPFETSKSFQVEFEVRKGKLSTTGGISIDDINLSELQCPHATLQINNLPEIYNTSNTGDTIYSSTYYSTLGYAYAFSVSMQHPYIGMYIQLVSGKYDEELSWPVPDSHITMQMVDQTTNFQNHMSYELSVTSNYQRLNGNGTYLWGKPEDHGKYYIDENNQTVYYGPYIGSTRFRLFKKTQLQHFLKGGNAVFNVFFDDVSPLKYVSELPCPPEGPQKYDERDEGPCHPKPTTHPHTTDDHPHTTDDHSIHTATTHHPHSTDHHSSPHPHTTTKDKSVFDFAPDMISSPVLILLGLLIIFMQ